MNRKILFFIFILEAGVIGVLGSLLGIGVGYLLALGSIGMLTDTVNALYFATSMEALALTWTDCIAGLGIGVFFSLLAGWLPARDAMSTPPAQVLSKGDWSPGFDWLSNPKTGICLLLFGALALLPPPFLMEGGSNMPVGGFLAAGSWILGAALLSGQMLVLLARWLRPFCQGPVSRLACSRLRDGSSRHRLAVAGLVVAVGMVTGMFQMVDSFRGTIREWFDVRFQAELYVSERGVSGAGNVNGIDPSIMKELLEDPAIEYADAMYLCHARPKVGITLLAGVDMDAWTSRIRQIWLKKPGSLDPVENSEPALVSETFARRFGVLEGGVVEPIPRRKKLISPIGIFTDYGNEFGTAAVSIDSSKKWTGSIAPSTPASISRTALRFDETKDRLRLAFPGLEVRNAQELRPSGAWHIRTDLPSHLGPQCNRPVRGFCRLAVRTSFHLRRIDPDLDHLASFGLFEPAIRSFGRFGRGRHCPGGIDLRRNRGARHGMVAYFRNQRPVLRLDSSLANTLSRFSPLRSSSDPDRLCFGMCLRFLLESQKQMKPLTLCLLFLPLSSDPNGSSRRPGPPRDTLFRPLIIRPSFLGITEPIAGMASSGGTGSAT